MLIAVAGLGPGMGVTTTTAVLATTWPGPEPVLMVDANLRSGVAPEVVHGPAAESVDGLELCPAGTPESLVGTVPMLHPPSRAATRGSVAAAGQLAVVFADCGAVWPVSATKSIVSGADAVVVVVRVDLTDPVLAGQRVRELTADSRRRGVVLVGRLPGREDDYLKRLQIPVLGWLPWSTNLTARLVPSGLRRPRGDRLVVAAREVGRAIRTQLAVATPGPCSTADRMQRGGGGAGWRRDLIRRSGGMLEPSVYPLPVQNVLAHTAGCVGSAPPTFREIDTVDRTETNTVALDRSAPTPGVTADDQPPSVSGWQDTARPRAAAGHLPSPTCAPSIPARTARRNAPLTAAVAASAGRGPVVHAAPRARHAAAPAESPPALTVQLFGPVRVMWRPSRPEQGCPVPEVEITGRLQRRSREVLALLATHSHGLTRTQLVDALWGECGPRRPSNAVCTTLARLRTAVAEATDGAVTRIVDTASGRLRLDQGVTRADYTEFSAAVARRRTTAAVEGQEVCERIVELAASGVLAADLDAGWLAPLREATRRDAIAALAALTQTLLGTDPGGAARWLETGLIIDPYNELVYRDLLRLHARLGEHHAIDDTLALLTRHLADIGEKPSRETQALARHLKEQCGASR